MTAVEPGSVVYLDTAPLIYAIEEHPDYGTAVGHLLQAIDEGRLEALTSTLTLAELLVKPFELDRTDLVRAYRSVLTGSAGMRVAPVDVEVAVEAARIRSAHRVRLADAVHLATAVHGGADVFVTNDASLGRCDEIAVVLVSDLEAPQDDAPDG